MSDSASNLHHYDMESLAKSLKLTSIDVIKTSSVDIESHWFRSRGPADLYFWKTEDRIVKHQVSIFNQVVEWNEFDGVKTGYVSDEEDSGRTEVIYFDSTVNGSVVEQAVSFLSNVRELDSRIVEQLIQNYKFYNHWNGGHLAQSLKAGLKRLFRRKK